MVAVIETILKGKGLLYGICCVYYVWVCYVVACVLLALFGKVNASKQVAKRARAKQAEEPPAMSKDVLPQQKSGVRFLHSAKVREKLVAPGRGSRNREARLRQTLNAEETLYLCLAKDRCKRLSVGVGEPINGLIPF